MNTHAKVKFSVILILIMIVICILGFWLVIGIPQPYKPRKEPIDTSAMGEEVPVKIVTLNSNMATNGSYKNYEIAYLLGDKGNLYVLCYDAEKYYVELWHPEFWKDIEVVDICAERPYWYASALDKEGNVYIWKKEYLLGEGETEEEIETKTNKRENWKIQQLNNIPKVTKIYATHDQFAIVTDEENVCMWSPKENDNPGMDDMEIIDMETPMLNIAAAGEEVFILDENHVLWSMENGTKTFVKENVKSIVQGYKGLAIQMMDNANEVYIYNIDFLQKRYERVTFADKYEVSKIVFADNISSMSLNGWVGVAYTDKQELYRWGWEQRTKYAHVTTPSIDLYKEPVKIDLTGVKHFMVIGKYFIYIDGENEMFVWI